MSGIEPLLACSPLGLVGPTRRLLGLGERVLASIADEDALSVLVARIGAGASLAELIAIQAAARPSGIAMIAARGGERALALCLRDGTIVGAAGTGARQTLAEWTLEFRTSLCGSVVESATQFDPGRTYVTEAALDAMTSFDHAGAGFALVQGPLQWLDDRLEDGAPSLDHLLLEHARRGDELPRIAAKIGATDRVIVPLAPPGERAARPTQKVVLADEAESGWDFFDDPDPAAVAEWNDARRVFELCDGMTTIEGVVERSMLGRFRTLAAVLALVERSHVALMAHFTGCDDASDELLESFDDVG
jgi:hypothetical protein